MLASKHAHPRDKNITFFKENHVYEVNGDRTYTSTTTFIHLFFPHFDAKHVIRKMRLSSNWEKSAYYGMTDDEILKKWDDKRDHSSTMGTMMHEYIEDVYNDVERNKEECETISKEIGMFEKFHSDYIGKLGYKPYRTEWYIYNEEDKIAGSIDMVFLRDPQNTDRVSIFDWKRIIALKEKNPYQKAFKPIDYLDDCNFNIYSLQLNMYKYILETYYNKTVEEMKLVIIHPDNDEYYVKDVPVRTDEIRALLFHQKEKKSSLSSSARRAFVPTNRRPLFL